jgi:hypothetical protein
MVGVSMTIAYIDPGTGSFLLQSAIAGARGVFFYFRAAIKRLVDRLLGRNRTPPSDDPNASDG